MSGHIPPLRAVPSVGNFAAQVSDDWAGTPCGGCQELTDPGDMIVKYRRSWWHKTCADRDIEQGNPRAAWIALGHDLARNPGGYRVRETRAIVGALLGMVHDPDADAAYPDDEDVAS